MGRSDVSLRVICQKDVRYPGWIPKGEKGQLRHCRISRPRISPGERVESWFLSSLYASSRFAKTEFIPWAHGLAMTLYIPRLGILLPIDNALSRMRVVDVMNPTAELVR